MRRVPYNRNSSENPLSGFGLCRLQRVWRTLDKLLLDSFPTLRRQLGDPTVNVLLEINGYEFCSFIPPFRSIVSLLLFDRLLELGGFAVLLRQQPARH